MQRYVEKLRKQPGDVRSHAAFVGAMVVTALVAVVWLGTLPGRLADTGAVAAEYEGESFVPEESFLQGIKNSVANAFSATSNQESATAETEPEVSNQLDLDAAMQIGAGSVTEGGVEVVEPDTVLIEATSESGEI